MPDLPFPADTTEYKLCRTPDPKHWLWAAFAPSGHTFGPPTFQLTVTARGRSAKSETPLLASASTRPLATVTLAGEAFPLSVGWHERRRGGTLAFGGERRTGTDQNGQSGTLCWQMTWTPCKDEPGVVDVQCRIQHSSRRAGDLTLELPVALFSPVPYCLPAAEGRRHAAQSLFSSYSGHALWLASLDGPALWNTTANAWQITLRRFPLGGGRTVRFSVGMTPAASDAQARAGLVKTYTRLAGNTLHPLPQFPILDPARPFALLSDPARYAAPGTERLYLRPPGAPGDGAQHAGHPFYPLDALKHMSDYHRLHPNEHVPRLARFGASGIAADFQVMGNQSMGREGLPQPNKGAFWDKTVNGWGKDWQGQPRHGIASNARMARALFLLHRQGGDALLRQSALNICQWLILKTNEQGVWDGPDVHATQGTDTDGRVILSEGGGAWAGVDAVRAFVLAYGATRNEVYIKAAWKVAHVLLERLPSDGDALPAATLATVVLNLLALNAEADNAQLRQAITDCGTRLLLAPPDAASSDDGLYSNHFECALALFALHGVGHERRFLRAGLSVLSAVPQAARDTSWRAIECVHAGLLSLCGLLADARLDPDALSVHLDWRIFAPDPAADRFVFIAAEGGPLWALPLVCRASSQLLVLALAGPETHTLCLTTGGRRPPVFDLVTDTREAAPVLHPLGGKKPWAQAALLTVDP